MYEKMKYSTTKEISCILGVNVKTIQKLIREHKLVAFRISGRYLVEETSLKDYINARKV